MTRMRNFYTGILFYVHLQNISSAFQWFDCTVNDFVDLVIEEEISVVSSTIENNYSHVVVQYYMRRLSYNTFK